MRSLQSMLIAASTLGQTLVVYSEGEIEYEGKNPRDAYQAMRALEEVELELRCDEGNKVDWAFVLPFEDDYICDCDCDGFFDKWSSN